MELNELFEEIEDKIIFPTYLNDSQRRKVFDPREAAKLLRNPIVMEIEGRQHTFKPIDRFKQMPSSKHLLTKTVLAMNEIEDWENLPTLLAGFRKAGIKLKQRHRGRLIRIAASRGKIWAVILCARQAEDTGFFLIESESVARILTTINHMACVKREYQKTSIATKKALGMMDQILDMLHRPEHQGYRLYMLPRTHNYKPIRGMILYAHAAYIDARREEGHAIEEEMPTLKDEVDHFLALWKDVKTDPYSQREFVALMPENRRPDKHWARGAQDGVNESEYIQIIALCIKGIMMTRGLLDDPPQALGEIQSLLEKHLDEFWPKTPETLSPAQHRYEIVFRKPYEPFSRNGDAAPAAEKASAAGSVQS